MTDTKLDAGPKDNAAEVARQAVEALLAGKDHVVTGSFLHRPRRWPTQAVSPGLGCWTRRAASPRETRRSARACSAGPTRASRIGASWPEQREPARFRPHWIHVPDEPACPGQLTQPPVPCPGQPACQPHQLA